MSSRVQKGNAVFRPVAKPRARASATPVPSASDSGRASHAPSMPPPAVSASRGVSVTSAPNLTQSTVEPEGSTAPPDVAPSEAPLSTPVAPATSLSVPQSSETRPGPPVLVSGRTQTTRIPLSTTITPRPIAPVAPRTTPFSGGSTRPDASTASSEVGTSTGDSGGVPPPPPVDSATAVTCAPPPLPQQRPVIPSGLSLSSATASTSPVQAEYAEPPQWQDFLPAPLPTPAPNDSYGPFGPPPGAMYPTPPPTQLDPGAGGPGLASTSDDAFRGQPPADWPPYMPFPPQTPHADMHPATLFPHPALLAHAGAYAELSRDQEFSPQIPPEAEQTSPQQVLPGESTPLEEPAPLELLPVPDLSESAVQASPAPVEATKSPAPATTKRKRSAKAKGKQKAIEPAAEADDPSEPRPKRTRRTRKKADATVAEPAEDDQPEAETEGGAALPAKRKRRRTRSSAIVESADDVRDVEASAEDDYAESDDASDSQPALQPRKKRASRASTSTPKSSARRGRRKKHPTPPPFDVDADPGAEPDPTTVTMADLCEDSGTGRVSSKAAEIISNFASWKAAGRVRRAALAAKAEAKKYGRSDDEEGQPRKEESNTDEAPADAVEEVAAAPDALADAIAAASAPAPGADGIIDEDASGAGAPANEDGFDYSQSIKTTRFAVQVRIGPNGETIVDEQSLFVDRDDEEDETAGYTHIEESDLTKFSNSASHSKKVKGRSRWSAEETELFFDALCQFGENYELISLVLPGRDRLSCKNKFKAEDKRNSNRIDWCLKNRQPYDINTLARMTGKDFSGPTPVIRMPTPLVPIANPENVESGAEKEKDKAAPPASAKRKKKSKKQELAPDEEIVGRADSFVDSDD